MKIAFHVHLEFCPPPHTHIYGDLKWPHSMGDKNATTPFPICPRRLVTQKTRIVVSATSLQSGAYCAVEVFVYF